MAKTGVPSTPLAILEKRGSWRAKNKVKGGAIVTQVEQPLMPLQLKIDPIAVQKWNELINDLNFLGVLSSVDSHVLFRYCVLYSEFMRLHETVMVKYKGHSTYPVKNKAGELIDVKQFPEAKAMRAISPQLLAIERMFGLNPSARAEFRTGLESETKQVSELAKDPERFFND